LFVVEKSGRRTFAQCPEFPDWFMIFAFLFTYFSIGFHGVKGGSATVSKQAQNPRIIAPTNWPAMTDLVVIMTQNTAPQKTKQALFSKKSHYFFKKFGGNWLSMVLAG
jgi:hypothetical protein